MKIGIIGLPQVGKKTIFKILTGVDTSTLEPEKLRQPVKGIITVKDPRFDKLVSLYKPVKATPAHIESVLMPKIDKDYIEEGALFEHLDNADAICHIARAFKDDIIYHVEGSVDYARDIDFINTELMLSDLIFVEKRLERIEKESKKGIAEKSQEMEKAVLLKFKEQLDKSLPLRTLAVNEDYKKIVGNYPLITLKPLIIVLNINEDDIKKPVLGSELIEKYKTQGIYATSISAKIENELASLDSKEEKEEFLKELGIDEPAIDKLTRILYNALNFMSFFTCCEKEVRAWTVKMGISAPEAAGAIHSDMERGFIRAEVMKYKDLAELGSEHRVKEAGRLMVKGKDYIVEDGDILNIRFSV